MNEGPSRSVTEYTGSQLEKLFQRCVQSQDLVEQTNSQQLAQEWLFEDCKITPVPIGAPVSLVAQRYRELVDILKLTREDDEMHVWHWLGHWLKSENIRNPVKFFPKGILKQMVRASQLEPARLRNARIVRIWLPYTEPLVRKVKWRRQAKMKDWMTRWETQAYDPSITRLALNKERKWNSAVEFTCEWIAEWSQTRQKKYDRDYLVTSYSKCVANSWIGFKNCSFADGGR